MGKRLEKILKWVGIISLILISIFILEDVFEKEEPVIEEITYDKVISHIKQNEILQIVLSSDSSELVITLMDGTVKKSVIPSVDSFSTFISDELENGNEIEFKVEKQQAAAFSGMFSIFTSLLLILMLRRSMNKMMNGEKQEIEPIKSKFKFSDVAGIDEEKAQLEEVVKFLKEPERYHKSGAKIPRGILLNGEPGTGKTLLAKAVAGEAGVPFFQVTGSSFEEKFVGVGASRIRNLFKKAKEVAPCIIFIDEIDSVGQNRHSTKSYSEQTLNQLLAEMDGFNTKDNIIVIAATNHMEVLDSALTRAGRFDRHVYVPMPDILAREKILEVHARNKKFDVGISLADIAKKTVGFSGADLENVLNEAAIYAVNHGDGTITQEAIDESIARVLVGLAKKNSAMSELDKRLTAIHEAGHAIVSAVVRPEVKNFGISIVPRGKAGGYNFFDESAKIYYTKSDLQKQIQVLYGGRVAEEIVLGDISSGAANDLEKATKIAHLMVTKFAMSEYCNSYPTRIPGEDDFNKQLEASRTDEVFVITSQAYTKAKEAIETHKSQLLELTDLLVEKEYLSQEDVEEFMKAKI